LRFNVSPATASRDAAMGYEYELRFTDANDRYTSFNVNKPSPNAIDQVLRAAPGFLDVDGYGYRFQVEGEDIRATIEPYGIYLCLSAPALERHLLFNHLVHRILSLYAGLEILEL
jgi:hypothetical protein